MLKTKDRIRNTINIFANSFDLKDWDALKSVLAASVYSDYRDLRGTAEVVTRSDYVSGRIKALADLQTHHLFSNYQVSIENQQAECILSSVIWRQNGNSTFTTHAIYNFKLKSSEGNWRIHAIKQNVLWNEGDSSIHSAVVIEPKN
ncbi:MAG: nuclear transport factor 2 family protein [Balneolaceae bacterium]|jgi:hypothetical protein